VRLGVLELAAWGAARLRQRQWQAEDRARRARFWRDVQAIEAALGPEAASDYARDFWLAESKRHDPR